ncbi:replication restart helicase PriA [Anaeromassilibacillus sp. An200]|uniref:replication restart helicase PriA n=1 Tax=Anaeromassilibacillus sp. An200 TaxID=1965587 RepID=UPI000B370924|nr:primosomal protein N' [Anaeromassilibacillus sp. An200]OUP14255.1 primosomal protein N' [Anaeromassilibacillus sp. An200]
MRKAARVAVEKTAYHFDREFDYCVPNGLLEAAVPGCRVLVPFGNANARRLGIILELVDVEENKELKAIAAVLDQAPLLSDEGIRLLFWLKQRYFCTLFDAVRLLLPAGMHLRLHTGYRCHPQKEFSPVEEEEQVMKILRSAEMPLRPEQLSRKLPWLSKAPHFLEEMEQKGLIVRTEIPLRQIGDATQKMVRLTDRELPQKLTLKQQAVLSLLEEGKQVSLKELCYFTGVTPAVVQTLVRRGAVELFDQEIFRNPYADGCSAPTSGCFTLSEDQEHAFQELLSKYRQGKPFASLLYGVTGSGKTSVFLRLADEVRRDGRDVIVMVPEISLTPQTVAHFHNRYGKDVAVFHSGLTLAERMDEWKRVKNGEAHIAVGTRSAVFAPLSRIGLIILDEEQEYTYKSESSPRYHARDVAKFRSVQHQALLLLCSATPSVESYYAAEKGQYSLVTLPSRYGTASLPEVQIVDMNQEMEEGNTTVLSRSLCEALRENLERKQQAILLLNRRGYHTFVSCRACGEPLLCPNCSISLTYHADNERLVCHYCGYSSPMPQECPHCHEQRLYSSGSGTQRAEEQLSALFPQARVLRLDADAAMSRFSYEEKLSRFAAGEYDLIVGTQMVAKGLDFENVTLAAVLSADQTLYSDDFRSYERAFSLLTQVVGRSGRGRYTGKAMIQTYTPENPIFQMAASQDYLSFYREEIALRQAMLYPPFVDICMVGFSGQQQEKVHQASLFFLQLLQKLAAQEYASLPMRVLKPTPAAVVKVNGKYRYKILIKCRNSKMFRDFLSRLLICFPKERRFAGVSVFADINPDSVL